MIPLERVRAPDVPRRRAAPERHRRASMSSLGCTGPEGEPAVVDRARVRWPPSLRPAVVGGTSVTAPCRPAGVAAARHAPTVGPAGFLPAIVQRWLA